MRPCDQSPDTRQKEMKAWTLRRFFEHALFSLVPERFGDSESGDDEGLKGPCRPASFLISAIRETT